MPLFEVIPQGHCVWTWTKWKATEGMFCHAKSVLEPTAQAVMLIMLRRNNVLQDAWRISDWFYAVFWRIAENRLQNDWFYIVFCNYWFANGCFISCFGSTDPS